MIEVVAKRNESFHVVFVEKEDIRIEDYGMHMEKAFQGEYLDGFYIPMEGRAELLIGCGGKRELSLVETRELGAVAAKLLKKYNVTQCSLDVGQLLNVGTSPLLSQFVIGLELGNYTYKAEEIHYGAHVQEQEKKDEEGYTRPESTVLYQLCGIENTVYIQRMIQEAQELAKNIIFARDMVNTPGNLLRPMDFNRSMEKYLSDVPVEINTIVYGQLKILGLQGIYGIGGSSEYPPCLMILRYKGAPESGEILGYIGKGVTCDTGGYCLKGAQTMAGIKGDMAGAAAVAGAIHAAAVQNLKVNITAVLPLCENRISQSSHLPGDVITSYSGKTIEILNTDAEGRLILADAVSYAVHQERVTRIVDIATLTGAVWQALGYTIAGSMSDDDSFYHRFELGLLSAGEKYLRFPYGKEHEKMIQSDVADLKNTGGNCCGSITAGLFIKQFTEEAPWIHLDIAGTAWNDTPAYSFESKGATGAGVLSLYYLAKEMQE